MAGNFAGHLDQAGEAADFVTVTAKEGAPKGIFPWYVPGYDGQLGEFPLSHDALIVPRVPESDGPLNLQIEPEVGLACEAVWHGDTVASLRPFAPGPSTTARSGGPTPARSARRRTGAWRRKALPTSSSRLGDLTPDGPTATLRLLCHLRTADGVHHEYGVDSPLLGYSYHGEVLLDWIVERLANQKGSPETPLRTSARCWSAPATPARPDRHRRHPLHQLGKARISSPATRASCGCMTLRGEDFSELRQLVWEP